MDLLKVSGADHHRTDEAALLRMDGADPHKMDGAAHLRMVLDHLFLADLHEGEPAVEALEVEALEEEAPLWIPWLR